METIAEPGFLEKLANTTSGLTKHAFIGDLCVQAYLYRFNGNSIKRAEEFFRAITQIEAISSTPSRYYTPPEKLGIFASHYYAMISMRNTIEISYDSKNIQVPVIPVEHLIAMKLCSPQIPHSWDIGSLVKTGRDYINSEMIRGILKSVGKESNFERYKEMLYDL
ncbi:MAG: hypothetical protein AABX52_03470 [Nanoarchaeota archaeon]